MFVVVSETEFKVLKTLSNSVSEISIFIIFLREGMDREGNTCPRSCLPVCLNDSFSALS